MRNASKYERDFDENKYVFFDKKCLIAKKIEHVWDKSQQYYQKKRFDNGHICNEMYLRTKPKISWR